MNDNIFKQALMDLPILINAVEPTAEKPLFVFWNKECEKVLGYSAEEMIGNPDAIDLLYPDKEYLRDTLEKWKDQNYQLKNQDIRVQTKNGIFKVIEWTNPDFIIPGWGTWAVGKDVTERNQFEDSLREAKLLAERASNAKSAFLANMSHELRTPMNSIIGFNQLIFMQDDISENVKRFSNLIMESSNNLLGIINSILDVSKIEMGKMTLEIKSHNIRSLIESIINVIGSQKKQTSFEYYIDDDVPEQIITDKLKVIQIVSNLLGNAFKFTKNGNKVKLKVERRNEYLSITIKDQGIGIPLDKLESIFKPFEQVDGSMTRSFGGVGLGLSIVKRLTELLKGNISVESKLDKGTTFTVEIPLNFNMVKLQSTKHILVVEDDVMTQTLLESIFSLDEMRETILTIAPTARKGLEFINKVMPDLIYMDIHLPDMNGVDAINIIRNELYLKEVPIVIMTADLSGKLEDEIKNINISEFLSKPISIPDFINLTHSLIN